MKELDFVVQISVLYENICTVNLKIIFVINQQINIMVRISVVKSMCDFLFIYFNVFYKLYIFSSVIIYIMVDSVIFFIFYRIKRFDIVLRETMFGKHMDKKIFNFFIFLSYSFTFIIVHQVFLLFK